MIAPRKDEVGLSILMKAELRKDNSFSPAGIESRSKPFDRRGSRTVQGHCALDPEVSLTDPATTVSIFKFVTVRCALPTP